MSQVPVNCSRFNVVIEVNPVLSYMRNMYESCPVTFYGKQEVVKLDTSKLKKKRGINRLLSTFSRAGKDIFAKWKSEKNCDERTKDDEIVTRVMFVNPENSKIVKISNDTSANNTTPVIDISSGEICKADCKHKVDSEANKINEPILHADQLNLLKVDSRYSVGVSSKEEKIVTQTESNIETCEYFHFQDYSVNSAKEVKSGYSDVKLHTTEPTIPEILNVQQDDPNQAPSTESTLEDCVNPAQPQSFPFASDKIEKEIILTSKRTLMEFDESRNKIYNVPDDLSEEGIEFTLHLVIQNSKNVEKFHFSANNGAFEELNQSFYADSETDSFLSRQTSFNAIPSPRIYDRQIVSTEDAKISYPYQMPSIDEISIKIKFLRYLKTLRDNLWRYSTDVNRRNGSFVIRCMWKLTGFVLKGLATFIQNAILRVEDDLEFYCFLSKGDTTNGSN